MIDHVYIDAQEGTVSVAARYPRILEAVPGGLRYIGDEQTVTFCHLDDSRAAFNGALRRFARGG